VDPISHAALGRMLVGLDHERRLGPGATAAAVLGALSPDLDLVRAAQGWDVYLRAHQAGTHSMLGAVASGVLTAAALRLFARRGRLVPLAIAAIAGATSHVFLDLISGADIQVWWPLSRTALTLPLFAMADPWLLGFFLIGLIALRRRPRRVAMWVLLGLAAIVTTKAVLYTRALAIDRHDGGGARPVVHIESVFGSWRRWAFFHAGMDVVDRWDVDVIAGSALSRLAVPRSMTAPHVAASRDLPAVANLLASHAATFARVRAGERGTFDVLWSDLRYCDASRSDSEEPVCAIWMGGEYDAGGRPRTTIVHVGGFVQRRWLAPADQ
jgi:membrane-bound metal-dependent hydrolase YbcI (DUF457 family)